MKSSLFMLIKPASGHCNMNCCYCFYTDEMKYQGHSKKNMMTKSTLALVLEKGLQVVTGSFTIIFQGGEPTLIGLEFYHQVIELVKKHNVNQCQVHYSIQTNGLLIDDTWCVFFKQHNFLVGISLDGYQELHDKYRKDANGKGTFEQVIASIDLLKKYQVQYNTLTVVHRETALNVNRVYNFFKKHQITYQQYIECLEPFGEIPGAQEYSLTPELYQRFLIKIFNKWHADMLRGTYVYNRYFENLLIMLKGNPPEGCAMQGWCTHQIIVESDGSVYPCDFYAMDNWLLGNLTEDSIPNIDRKREELGFIEMSKYTPDDCKNCRWFLLCRNGCRRSCEPVDMRTRQKNYYCKAYKGFFEYAYPKMIEILHKC